MAALQKTFIMMHIMGLLLAFKLPLGYLWGLNHVSINIVYSALKKTQRVLFCTENKYLLKSSVSSSSLSTTLDHLVDVGYGIMVLGGHFL